MFGAESAAPTQAALSDPQPVPPPMPVGAAMVLSGEETHAIHSGGRQEGCGTTAMDSAPPPSVAAAMDPVTESNTAARKRKAARRRSGNVPGIAQLGLFGDSD